MSLARVAVLGALGALIAAASGCRTFGSSALATSTKDFPKTWSDEGAPPAPVAASVARASAPAPRSPPARATPKAVAPAAAQGAPHEAQGTVILNDGTRIAGRITTNRPGELVTVISDGAERTFLWERVDEVVIDAKP